MPTPSDKTPVAVHIDNMAKEADLVIAFRGRDAFIVKDREGPSTKNKISIEAALFRITQHRADLKGGDHGS